MEAELYDDKRFSDFSIQLANGVTINVHKIVLCRKNEYFNSMCGPESRFAESNQSTIELKNDNPTALEALIRWLYTLPVAVRNHEPCDFWLAVRVTADKYLAKDLSQKAFEGFWRAALHINTAEEIFTIIGFIERDMSHDTMLMDAAARLRKRWLHPLLAIPAFRDQLSEDTDLMLELLEHASRGTVCQETGDPFGTPKYHEKKLVRFSHEMKAFLCEFHKKAVFHPDTGIESGGNDCCSYCSIIHGVDGLPFVGPTCVTLTETSWLPAAELAGTAFAQTDFNFL